MTLQTCKCICALTIFVFLVPIIGAQQLSAPEPQAAMIEGTVFDVTGGVVPGATVILQGQSQNDRRQVLTLNTGFFKIDGVKPSTQYRVIVIAKGFANWTSKKIVLMPGQYFILTGIQLRIATVQQAVTVVPRDQVAVQQVKAQEKQRIAGFIPNFYVVYDQNAASLTPKLKFHLAAKFLTDPVTTAGFALNAAIYQIAGYPGYRQGAKGYGQRLGATFAGGYTNILVGDAILPSLLHQDTRYFYRGKGTTKSRLMHALSSPFVIRGDDGRREINFSDIGSNLASGAIANAYYPDRDRGAKLVLTSALIGAGGRMANAVFQEFLLRKFTSRAHENAH